MSETDDNESGLPLTGPQLQRGFLLVLVLGITLLFLVMIRSFVVTLILAGILAGMAQPTYQALADRMSGRRRMASALTVLGILLLILLPLGAFLALVVTQAAEVTEAAGPWLREQAARWPELTAWVRELPLVGGLVPEGAALAERASEVVSRGGSFLINAAGAATQGTVNVVLQLFVMLYALYFFLLDGPKILARVLYYVPLSRDEESQLVGRFVSVARATLKGSLLVGLVQGVLAGSAFFVLGLPAPAFWTTVMGVLSVIPVLGSGIVWGPAAVILMATGRVVAGLGLAVWGIVVVSTIDNVLRPRLVGRDTQMHDLLVLLSTFGGLAMFGLVGFIIGPIVAALALTAWDLYGVAFEEILPDE